MGCCDACETYADRCTELVGYLRWMADSHKAAAGEAGLGSLSPAEQRYQLDRMLIQLAHAKEMTTLLRLEAG